MASGGYGSGIVASINSQGSSAPEKSQWPAIWNDIKEQYGKKLLDLPTGTVLNNMGNTVGDLMGDSISGVSRFFSDKGLDRDKYLNGLPNNATSPLMLRALMQMRNIQNPQ